MVAENRIPSLSPGSNPPAVISRLPVYLVVATGISGPFEELVRPLATHLKRPDSEIRRRLTGALPRLVRVTRERDGALETLAFLRQRGVRATACDARAVHATSHAVSLLDCSFTDRGVLGRSVEGEPVRLPYDDALCLLPAFRNHYALYVFARSGGRPWLLNEDASGSTNPPRVSDYPGQRQRRPNQEFSRRVHDLQRALPHAVYDERLLTMDLGNQCSLLRAGDGAESPWSLDAKDAKDAKEAPDMADDGDSRVTRRSWPGAQEPPSGLISPLLRVEAAQSITTDVMAHLIALAYSRGYF